MKTMKVLLFSLILIGSEACNFAKETKDVNCIDSLMVESINDSIKVDSPIVFEDSLKVSPDTIK